MLKKYNLAAEEVGQVAVPECLKEVDVSGQLIKDYIVAIRANARQWSANTKGRSEVSHSTQKPHPQKGQGRSRQGSLAAPQYKGGGRVFGPKPKFDQHVKVNKKQKRLAIRKLLSDKIEAGKLHVIESTVMDAPKTSRVAQFKEKLSLGRRILFVVEASYDSIEFGGENFSFQVQSQEHDSFVKSVRNLEGATMRLLTNTSGLDYILAHDVVITEKALNDLVQWVG